ncbi:uncharacterized protein [Diadema antillarum]|uniref:uncharacterized protein n=1 Tax=Diadema antillarum TaxID=105358 RepID=UPI003A8AB870
MQQAAARSLLAFRGRCMDVNFDIGNSNYKPLEKIGTGAYGVVCSAVSKKNGEKVAIKKIPNAFDELTTAKRTFRELKILRHFRHENIIGIREILMPKEPLADIRDVYVVFDLMESDLHQIIHSNQPFSLEHIRFFLYQILRGLKYIHSADVIHRDLKPSNLLVNENCELKVGDFGMARGLSTVGKDKKRVFMTSYVATRWYRAPELLFSCDDYTLAVDIWSVGCILGEMIGRKQMFPGKNPVDQLSLIVDTLGMPPINMLTATKNEGSQNQLYNFIQRSFANKTPKDLSTRYPKADPQAVDLLKKMLVYEPAKRITVTEALQHPFLATYYSPDDEPICFPKFDFSFENNDMSREQIRQQVGKMILKYNKPKGWIGKGVLNIVPKNTPDASKSVTTTNHSPLQTVSPSPRQSSLQTIGPATRGTLQTIGPSANKATLQTVGPSVNKGTLQTIGPSSKAGSLKTVGPSSEKAMHSVRPTADPSQQGTISVVRKGRDGENVTVSSGSPLIRESLLSGLSGPSLFFGATSDTSPKFGASDDVPSQGAFKPICDDKVKAETESSMASGFLGLPVVAGVSGSVSDVEMPSAKSTSGDSMASFLLSASKGKLASPAASLLVTSDIEMWSAKGESPSLDEQPAITDIAKPTDREVQPATGNTGASGDSSSSSGQKTISEDTKKLIKAALLNSAIKNQKKDRIDSTSSEPGKGGGKMTVTALSRQREREEKRKQKLRRSMKKKKMRQSTTEKQEPAVLLTEDDKNMLERWNRMQQSSEPENTRENKGGDTSSIQAKSVGAADGSHHVPTEIPKQVDSVQFPGNFKVASGGDVSNVRKTVRSPVLLAESPKFGATTDEDSNGFFVQLSPLNHGSYPPESPDFLSELDLPSGSNIFSSVASFPLNIGATGGEAAAPQGANTMRMGTTHDGQGGTAFAAALPTSTSQPMPFMPMFVSTSSRQRSGSGVFVSPKSPNQQLLYRCPADRETPSPPSHIPSPPSCLQQSPPDYAGTSKTTTANTAGMRTVDAVPHTMGAAPAQNPAAERRHDSTSSDISTIIRQLSRSMVEDPIPSYLSVPLPVTPKGDGGGYGLSLDLEEFMSEALGPQPAADDGNKCDSAPLSASLLSDWLDVRNLDSEAMKAIELDVRNLTTENMREIQRELGLTSPMGLSGIPPLHADQISKDTK